VNAAVAIVSPVAKAAKQSLSGVQPAFLTALAASTTLEKYGPAARGPSLEDDRELHEGELGCWAFR
jgi:hypothetical protein